MIICFDCSVETREMIEDLLRSGHYNDYGEVISFAVRNLSVLQKEIGHEGVLVLGSGNHGVDILIPDKSKRGKEKPSRSGKSQERLKRDRRATTEKPAMVRASSMEIPTIFLRDGLSIPDDCPPLIWEGRPETSSGAPLDKWIFGQYNKLLPAKASCRGIAHLLGKSPHGVVLTEATSVIAEKAGVLGDFLVIHDQRNAIKRDYALATAFPSSAPGAAKGRFRYANHFVGSANKNGQVSGLLVDLKLATQTQHENPSILLTKAGWQFACLANPILDGNQEEPTQKFTPEEIRYLIEHILNHVPVEAFAYRSVVTAIAEGANTPVTLDAALQKYASKGEGQEFSRSFLSSQRSGVISRLSDLSLVTRVREGVRVTYVLTTRAHQLTTETV